MQETHGKHVFNGSPKIGIHDKKDNNQKNRGDVLKLKMESQRVGNAVSRGVSARLGHDLTTAGSFIVPNNLPL